MGSGKTTLIKAMLHNLGAIDMGNSPTFSLVNEHYNAHGQLLAYHFDLYRIESLEEALDMGIETYFNSEAYLFIEWPRIIESLLPAKYHSISLQFIDETTRYIEF